MDNNFERVNPEKSAAIDCANVSRDKDVDDHFVGNLANLVEEAEQEEMTWMESLWLVVKRATPMIVTMIFFQMV